MALFGLLEVVVSFLSGSDIFADLPTGFEKRLCYACLPFELLANCGGGYYSEACLKRPPMVQYNQLAIIDMWSQGQYPV